MGTQTLNLLKKKKKKKNKSFFKKGLDKLPGLCYNLIRKKKGEHKQ
jgi:hypothetical protein